MKYNNFLDWFIGKELTASFAECDYGEKGWNAAVENFKVELSIAIKIKELLTTINNAEKIDCTCDQKQIVAGYRCGCGRGQAIQHASIELGIYLKKLREGLK